jgi:hypothetical protein
MSFQPLGRFLSKTVQYLPAKDQLVTARVIYIAGEIMGKLWPTEQASYVRVVSFNGGKLIFETSVGAAAQTLKMQLMSIQNAINRELGGKIVQSIEVRNV